MKARVMEVPISKIKGSLCKMRLEKDYEREELLASIAKHGVTNPIKINCPVDGKGKKGY